jgi:hypothetical protein
MPEGRTIAHGFLTLSLIPHLRHQIWHLEPADEWWADTAPAAANTRPAHQAVTERVMTDLTVRLRYWPSYSACDR